ncbi:hypothetical protein D3C85_973700 [compost metagenome]
MCLITILRHLITIISIFSGCSKTSILIKKLLYFRAGRITEPNCLAMGLLLPATLSPIMLLMAMNWILYALSTTKNRLICIRLMKKLSNRLPIPCNKMLRIFHGSIWNILMTWGTATEIARSFLMPLRCLMHR